MTSRSRPVSVHRRRSGDAFLAVLSHELRTPLNGVLGMAQLLAGTRLDADQRAYVAAIEQSGEHLLGLVNDVLDLARMDSGGFRLHPVSTELEHLLQSTAELLSPRAHARGLEIAWTAEPGLPLVMADEGRLRQILFNLAGNAVKFTETGGVVLSVARADAPVARETVRLRFAVRDTGPGVSAAERERIFEPFIQGSAIGVGQIESTGLGLAIVRRLAEAFGGVVGLDSRQGVGSCFWFEADFAPAGAASPGASLDGMTVLVVSANPVVAEAAAEQVRACGGQPLVRAGAANLMDIAAGVPALVDYAAVGRRRPRPLEGHPSIVMVKPEERGRLPALRRGGFAGYLIKPLRRKSLSVRILAVSAPPASTRLARAPVEDERIRASAAVGARVLLAEDNPINAMLGRALLEREGCAVDRVQTGPQAVEAALAQSYDLILLDLRMPGMDGMQAARAIRAAGVSTPIAALTADAFEDTRQACLAAGMDEFLTKPLDSAALRAVLARRAGPGFTQPRTRAKLAS